MYIFRDFRLENCTKTAFHAILRHYLTKNVHRCAIRERLEVTVHYDGYCDFSAIWGQRLQKNLNNPIDKVGLTDYHMQKFIEERRTGVMYDRKFYFQTLVRNNFRCGRMCCSCSNSRCSDSTTITIWIKKGKTQLCPTINLKLFSST